MNADDDLPRGAMPPHDSSPRFGQLARPLTLALAVTFALFALWEVAERAWLHGIDSPALIVARRGGGELGDIADVAADAACAAQRRRTGGLTEAD